MFVQLNFVCFCRTLDYLSIQTDCFNCRRFFPILHKSIFVQFLFIFFNSHQTFDRLLVFLTNIRSDFGESYILPYLFILFEQRFVDDSLNILGIFRVYPKINFFMRKNDRHAFVNVRQIWSGIFSQDYDLVVISVETSYQEVVSVFRSETERLFFGIPLIVAFHDDNAPVFDEIDEHSFVEQFLNSSVDDCIEFAVMSPFHVGKLFMLLQIFILDLFYVVFGIETTGFDNGNVSGWTDVVRTGVELLVQAFVGTSDLEQTGEGKGLEHSSAHLLLLLLIFGKIQTLAADLYYIDSIKFSIWQHDQIRTPNISYFQRMRSKCELNQLVFMWLILIYFKLDICMSDHQGHLRNQNSLKQNDMSADPQAADKKSLPDEERDKLISQTQNDSNKQSTQTPLQQQTHLEEQSGSKVIDAFQELFKNNNVMPILAVIDKVDLNIEVEGKPLLSKLCTMCIPLSAHLQNRQIVFKSDADRRTPLHQAIKADDAVSAHWCLENKIKNQRDNFGNTPILQAIKLQRKNCFLLCLHHGYYDSEAPHICAAYNRVWQLKVLHSLGYDIISTRDSEHFTPLQRAVQNYAYQAAEYLTSITPGISISDLASKTDSKGIIRLIKRTKEQLKYTNWCIVPFLSWVANIVLIYSFVSYLEIYKGHIETIKLMLVILLGLYGLLILLGFSKKSKYRHHDLMNLLKYPQFSVLEDICPQCLIFQDPRRDHCSKCERCIDKFHFHTFVCVNKKNEVVQFTLAIFWCFISLNLLSIFIERMKYQNLLILNFSSSFIFMNTAIINILGNQSYVKLTWFIYLRVLSLYYILYCFQWLTMLVLNRTYQEVNSSQKYKRLYRIVKTRDGNYKNQQIRIMENGLIKGTLKALQNIVVYFFR